MDVKALAEKLTREVTAGRVTISHSEVGNTIHGVLHFTRNQSVEETIKDLQKIKKGVMAVFRKEVLSKNPDAEPRMEGIAFIHADHKEMQFSMGYWT
jgi:hypothetical protein